MKMCDIQNGFLVILTIAAIYFVANVPTNVHCF